MNNVTQDTNIKPLFLDRNKYTTLELLKKVIIEVAFKDDTILTAKEIEPIAFQYNLPCSYSYINKVLNQLLEEDILTRDRLRSEGGGAGKYIYYLKNGSADIQKYLDENWQELEDNPRVARLNSSFKNLNKEEDIMNKEQTEAKDTFNQEQTIYNFKEELKRRIYEVLDNAFNPGSYYMVEELMQLIPNRALFDNLDNIAEILLELSEEGTIGFNTQITGLSDINMNTIFKVLRERVAHTFSSLEDFIRRSIRPGEPFSVGELVNLILMSGGTCDNEVLSEDLFQLYERGTIEFNEDIKTPGDIGPMTIFIVKGPGYRKPQGTRFGHMDFSTPPRSSHRNSFDRHPFSQSGPAVKITIEFKGEVVSRRAVSAMQTLVGRLTNGHPIELDPLKQVKYEIEGRVFSLDDMKLIVNEFQSILSNKY